MGGHMVHNGLPTGVLKIPRPVHTPFPIPSLLQNAQETHSVSESSKSWKNA
jgi:hypothetical protein